MPLRTKIALVGCALAHLLAFGLENIRIALVRTIHFLGQVQSPQAPQLRKPHWDHYLFEFLVIVYPVVAALMFFIGIRTMKQLIHRSDRFSSFSAFLFLYVLVAFSYILRLAQLSTPSFVQFLSFTVGAVTLAALARIRELYQRKQKTA